MWGGAQAQEEGEWKREAEKLIQAADTDNDHHVSKDELLKFLAEGADKAEKERRIAKELVEQLFPQKDPNSDGKLNKVEVASFMETYDEEFLKKWEL